MALEYTETAYHGNTIMAVPLKILSGHNMPMGYLDRLSVLRKSKGLTQSDLAERIGVEQPTIGRWETGKREPTLAQVHQLADILGVDAGSLIDPGVALAVGPRLFVKGEVAAGLWQPAYEWPEADWQSFTGRADVTAAAQHRFGLRITGDSMNELYPAGTIVECVSLFGHAEAKPGKRVVVIRRDIHDMYEATVKELVEQDGELWLVPRSTNPAHQPFRIGSQEEGIVETRIAAVVVASVRPE